MDDDTLATHVEELRGEGPTAASEPGGSLVDFLRETRAKLDAACSPRRTAEEIQAAIRVERDWGEGREGRGGF